MTELVLQKNQLKKTHMLKIGASSTTKAMKALVLAKVMLVLLRARQLEGRVCSTVNSRSRIAQAAYSIVDSRLMVAVAHWLS